MKCAVFSCIGLGDGLIALVLSHNLKNNGYEVTTFHPSLQELSSWFLDIEIKPFNSLISLTEFDKIFIIYEKSEWMQLILKEALESFRERTVVLNPIATANCDYLFWEEGKFDGRMSYVDNLVRFCKTVLQLDRVERGNGIVIPENCVSKQFERRVIIHPTSSKEGKNWSADKYRKVANQLSKKGFEPVFIVGERERTEWPEAITFSSLDLLARFVCESGYFIGNDSGIGHLASCLGLSTLTLCRNHQTGRFWRPSWAKGAILYPSKIIPNLKGMRLRDKYWREWITMNRVMAQFNRL